MKGQILDISDFSHPNLCRASTKTVVERGAGESWCWALHMVSIGLAWSLWDASQVLSTFSKRISILGTGYAEHVGLDKLVKQYQIHNIV